MWLEALRELQRCISLRMLLMPALRRRSALKSPCIRFSRRCQRRRVSAAGQTSYGFANMCGSELCRARRAAGLPALAVGWGPIANVGVMAESDKVQRAASPLDKGSCCPHASPMAN